MGAKVVISESGTVKASGKKGATMGIALQGGG